MCVLLTGLRGLWLGPKLWPLAPWLEGVRPGETVGLQWGSLGARSWVLRRLAAVLALLDWQSGPEAGDWPPWAPVH